jgi:hemin uptake protein HemP
MEPIMADDHAGDENANHDSDVEIHAETITSASILKDAREVWIDHNGERYRLRVTRKGKLILQK